MTSTGLNVPYSYMFRKYIDYIHPPLPSSFIFPSSTLPLTWPVYIPVLIVLVSVHCSVEFCLGILPVNIWYFNQSNISITLPYSFSIPCIVQQFSVCFLVFCSYTDVIYFNIIHSLLSSSFSPPFVSSNSLTIGNMFYTYMIMLVFVFGSIFHIWEKTCDLCLSELAYFT
jgi:hypothetical protein